MDNATNTSWFSDLFEELKRRRVIRVATLYVVVFWPIIQVVDILSPALALPDAAMRYLVLAFVTGLPIVLIFAWIFDLNKEGLVVDRGEAEGTGHALIGSRAELVVIGLLLVVAAGLLFVQVRMDNTEVVATAAPLSAPAAPPAARTRNSIAVLPFDTFSNDARDRFFADGLSEELLNVLARLNDLDVAARTSSFSYRDSRKTAQEIGAELGVAYVLEGSVRRNDLNDRIRVTAQLIDSHTDTHVWSETYDREFNDVFRIQDEIASSVVDQLKVTLLGNESKNMVAHASANPEAMITFSMGQTELARRTEVSMRDAMRFFKRALDLDPNYVEAWVGLADANTLMCSYGFGDRKSQLAAAHEAVQRALDLDPESGKAYASQGLLLSQEGNRADALAAFETALTLNPNYSMAHMWYASELEDRELAFTHFEKAYKLDPRSPVAGFNVAQQLINRGQEEKAMEVFARIVEADPYYPRAYELVARISKNRGRFGEALRQYEKAYELEPSAMAAFQVADLETTLGNFPAADEWIALAKPKEPPERLVNYDILQARRLVMQGDLMGARGVLAKITEQLSSNGGPAAAIAAFTAYMAGEFAEAAAIWDRVGMNVQEKVISNEVDVGMLNIARIGAAYSYLQTGQADKAKQQLALAEDRIREDMARGYHEAEVWYRLATIAAIRGETQMALINLQRAIDEGWADFWLPRVEPAFANLINEPQLASMLAGVETRIALIRDQLAFEESFASTRESTRVPGT
ncbi:MAG: tetratricopeptide repeat protein [Pseudomonadota bacterium]